MKTMWLPLLIVLMNISLCFGQVGGNIGYSQATAKAKAEQQERAQRTTTPGEAPPSSTTMFVDASVLMNVKADEYVVTFAIALEGLTVAECNQKMDATVAEFTSALKPLGISDEDIVVDFAAQHKIHAYKIEGNLAKETLVGFELKKNILIRYQDKTRLDKIVIAASKSNIFDLVKVDDVIKSLEPIQDRLMEEASRIIKRKTARHERLLGIHLKAPPQVYAEKSNVYYPTRMYESYTAFEAETIGREQYRSKYLIQDMRKSRTFFFNPLDHDGFDFVVNPVVVEPVVQCALYLKLKYEIEPK